MPSRTEEYRQMDLDELDTRVSQAKQELFNLRFQVVTGRLDNTARLGQVKRDVARMLTILREREIEAAEALDAGRPGAQAEVDAAQPEARATRRAARLRAAREAEASAAEAAADAAPAAADAAPAVPAAAPSAGAAVGGDDPVTDEADEADEVEEEESDG
jgi:large subunit ribosomal protein L29